MYLSHLHLSSFRNFREQGFEFGASFNILVGDNAQGKTNVIEAIAYCAEGRSFRTNEWRDLVAHDAPEADASKKTARRSGPDAAAASAW